MGVIEGLEALALARAMREWLWLYPIVEIVHLLGLALLFGSIAVLDVRLLGVGRSLPLRRLAAHVLPWTLASLLLIVPSGLAMFITHAHDFLDNPAFLLKMGLLAAAGVNALLFHFGVFRRAASFDVDVLPPPRARLAAALSLLLWMGVIACGRLLAYL